MKAHEMEKELQLLQELKAAEQYQGIVILHNPEPGQYFRRVWECATFTDVPVSDSEFTLMEKYADFLCTIAPARANRT